MGGGYSDLNCVEPQAWLWSHGPHTDLLEPVRLGLEQIIICCQEIDAEKAVGLNIVLSDGESVVGSRPNRTALAHELSRKPAQLRKCVLIVIDSETRHMESN
jgi:hypothetical protein